MDVRILLFALLLLVVMAVSVVCARVRVLFVLLFVSCPVMFVCRRRVEVRDIRCFEQQVADAGVGFDAEHTRRPTTISTQQIHTHEHRAATSQWTGMMAFRQIHAAGSSGRGRTLIRIVSLVAAIVQRGVGRLPGHARISVQPRDLALLLLRLLLLRVDVGVGQRSRLHAVEISLLEQLLVPVRVRVELCCSCVVCCIACH